MLTTDGNTEGRVIAEVRGAAAVLPPGARLPSVRELMARHRASPLTVQRAIAQLAAEGLVEPRPGRGTFVAATPAPAAATPDLSWQEVALPGETRELRSLPELLALPAPGTIPLSTGYLEPALQATSALGAALARAARRADAWDRLPVAGLPALRAWFARESGGLLQPHDVLITPGGQSALGTVFRGLGVPGETVLVESPTYLGAVAAAHAAGLRAAPVPADANGVRPDLLEAALHRTGARIVYLQPLWANPHGATLSEERRAAVRAAVAAAGAFLVEDDWARDLAIDGDPPPPLIAADPDGHVVGLRSLTKSAAPGLRVAAIMARGAAGARLAAARTVDDFFVSGPLQHAALDLVSSPAWARHRRALRTGLRERRDALVGALGAELAPAHVPAGGLHLWVPLPDGTDEAAVVAAARAAGVVVFGGAGWFTAGAPAPHLRLTFAGAPPDRLAEGVARLRTALG